MAVWKETGRAAGPATLILSSRERPARVIEPERVVVLGRQPLRGSRSPRST